MDFELFSLDDEIEDATPKIGARAIRLQEKIRAKNYLKKEKAAQVLTELPQPGESLHIVSNGSFDYFTLCPLVIDLLKKPGAFWFSTWTMNQHNVEQLFELYDTKKVTSIAALVGLYFKSREANVFNFLHEGIKERGQRLFCNENHAKITLMNNRSDFITIEGSANFTANPRIEQFSVTNSRELHDFHKTWMDELLP